MSRWPSPVFVSRRRNPVAPLSMTLALLTALTLTPAARAQGPADALTPAPTGPAIPPVSPVSWTRASLLDAPTGAELVDVVAGGPGFVAVGGSWPEAGPGPVAEVWTSVDGRSWSRVPLQGAAAVGQIRAIVATDDGLLAVGGRCCPDQGLVWRSADGLSWEVLPDDPVMADAALLSVAATSDGLVAVGCEAVMECSGGLAWTSVDGRVWSRPQALDWLPADVVAGFGGWVAVGRAGPYEGPPIGATSPDGSTWTNADIDVASGGLSAVVGYEVGAIACGGTVTGDSGASTGLLLGSDGETWGALDSASIADAHYEDLAWLGGDPTEGTGGLLLVGWKTTADGQVPATWWSLDGLDWQAGSFARELKGGGMIRGLAGSPDGTVVLVGSTILNRGQVPAAWVSLPGE